MALEAHGVDHPSSSFGSARRWNFKDDEELERGQVIKPSLLRAIEESLSAIVVLSPNYAYSTWCLDELSKILHSKKESGLYVFPIFSGVDPSNVEHQRGSFAEAFKKHEEIFTRDEMKVQNWRDALKEVANLSGWHSDNCHETKLIETIIEKVWSKIYDELPFDFEKLVGIESKIVNLNSLIVNGLGEVQFIGIWAIGGLGNTTLARAFYERTYKDFEVHCFLLNVREVYEAEEKWKDALPKLKKVPPNNILKILKVSFDELDHREKTIFLDIACFFNGMAKGPLIQILEILDEDLHPTIGIDVLIDKSLVINSEGYLWVHHILRDMGKYIVSQASSPNDAGKHSRILSLKDANDVLEGNKGTGAIRAIAIIVEETFNALSNPDAFSRMINLKLLVISSRSHISHCQLNLSRGIKSLPNGLKVLAWDGYPLDSLPNQTKLHELLVLKMKHSKLKELWRGARSPPTLKSIDLSYSKFLIKTPDFYKIPNLEIVILEGCSTLVEVHQSLGQYNNLVIVNLKGCKKVRTLPRKFEMDCLKIFFLSGCSKIRKLPEFEKDMKCLSTLDLENTAISKLPESLGNLIGLVELNLTGCTNLVFPPNNVHKFIARKIFKISGWSNLSRMPEDLNENGTLEVPDVGRISPSSWSCVSLLRKSFGLQRPLSSTNFMVPISLSFLSQLKLGYCKLHDGSLLFAKPPLPSLFDALDNSEEARICLFFFVSASESSRDAASSLVALLAAAPLFAAVSAILALSLSLFKSGMVFVGD
ncbi:TMV resistance protein N-like [Prosopis cineraria]|uniref:TMV resistance protein N-like n=1 Tax=Prosopis cineraria TaxID=364024 RepID=UPI00241079E9|nr:TMV resistance protein N-like [Prosopis cineraria]